MSEESIFAEACQKTTPEQRAAFLDEACAGDPELRRNLESLLAAYDEGEFIELPAQGLAATVDTPPITEKPGTVIGPYKLLQKIGEGGMGVVYMARQKVPIKRHVALKIIKPGMDTEQVIARFEAERQALAMMDHPNIAQVFDAGMTESGRPYFVMELVKGVSVTQYCDDQQLSPHERLDLFVAICQGVQHAHQKGIIHRDIKPSNVLIAEYDHRAVPKIIDFGVAKALHHELTEKTLFTQYGQVVGTLEYMSPEQAKLNQLDIDTRSDVYSLGVLLYELLTGTTPLTKKQLLSVGHDEMLRMIREKEPEKPSTRLSRSGQALPAISQRRRTEPKKLGALVRGELDWIVMKALEKNRNRRYETSLGLSADVRRFLNNEPVEACPPSNLYRLRKYVSRNKAATTSVVSVAAAVLIGLLGITVGLWRAQLIEATAARAATRQAFEYGINLAYEAWNRGNRNEVETIMQQLDTVAGEDERCGFDWRYIWGEYQDLFSAELITTTGEVLSISYHPSGKYLAIGCADGSTIVRDCLGARSMAIPEGLAGSHVAFSPNGTYLAASCVGFDNGDATRSGVWRFPSFEEVVWPEGPSAELSFVVFSFDESLLAGARADGALEIRRVLTGELVAKCQGHSMMPVRLAFSPNGRFLASVSDNDSDPMLRLWSMTGEMLDEELQAFGAFGLAFTPDGRALVVGGWRGARLWKLTEGDLRDSGQITQISVYSMTFSHEGMLALGCADQTVRMWDLNESREIKRLLHTSLVSAVAFSPDSRTLAAGTRDDVVHLWDDRLWRNMRAVRASTYYFPPLAVSLEGKVVTSEIRDGQHVLKLWHPDNGIQRDLWTDDRARIIGAAFSPDGSMVASASDDGTIRLGMVETGELLVERRAHTRDMQPVAATCVAFSLDGTTLVSGGSNSELLFWNLDAWSQNWKTYEAQERKGSNFVTSLAFSTTGHLASGGGTSWSESGEMIVWDLNSGSPEPIFRDHYPETVRCVAYTPDGSLIALTYKFSAGIVHVLNATTFKTILDFQSHSNKVTTLAFTLDGRRLITGSDDGTVRFWDLDHGKPVGTLQIGARVRNLAMLPGDNSLLTLSLDGWLRLWRAAP